MLAWMEIAPAPCVDVVDRHHQITPGASLHTSNFSPSDRDPCADRRRDPAPKHKTDPLGMRISNFAPKKPSNGVSLTLCGSASISGTDLSRPSSADSFVLCIRCLDGLPDLACGSWSRRGWTAIGPSWRSRRGSAFAQAAVGVQPIGTAGMSVIFKTCRHKERA